jgi:hypothetical protein
MIDRVRQRSSVSRGGIVRAGAERGRISFGLDSRPAPAISARCDEQRIYVTLKDGRVVAAALPAWLRAFPAERRRACRVRGFGTAIYFPEIDEEMGVNEVFGVPEDVLFEIAGFRKGDRTTD